MTTRHFYGWLQVIVLALTGLYFAGNLASGNVGHYIAARFIWLSWVAAALFLGMALALAERLLRGTHAHDHACHAHADRVGTGAWLGLGIVALPLLIGWLVPSQPLDSRAIEDDIATGLHGIDVTGGRALEIAPLERTVLDWVRAFNAARDVTVFEGQQADVTGFVYRDARFDRSAQFMVTRFVMSCCVADAQPVGVVVVWPDAATVDDDDWVRVRGTFTVREFDGSLLPVLVPQTSAAGPPGASGVQVVEQPDHPYLYP